MAREDQEGCREMVERLASGDILMHAGSVFLGK